MNYESYGYWDISFGGSFEHGNNFDKVFRMVCAVTQCFCCIQFI